MPGKGDPSKPNYESHAYRRMAPDLKLVRDVGKGTTVVRSETTTYLPKHAAEGNDDYLERLQRSVIFGAFERAVRGLSGIVFQQEPVIDEDVPAKIAVDLEDIDLAGTEFGVFARQVFEDALEAGHAAILVDAPVMDGPASNAATEALMGVRPYWVHVKKEDILSWRTVRVAGAVMLDQVVIRETVYEPKREFGEQEVVRYKVFRRADPVTWTTYEEIDGGEIMETANGIIANVAEIPLVPVYTDKTGVLESDPPLLSLAYTNVAHYQVQSDHLTALHKASVPILVMTGVSTDSAVPVGPNAGVQLPEGGTCTYTETTGAALGATAEQITKFETQMAREGMSMLQHETRAAETAEAKRIDKSEQDSTLSVAARSLQNATQKALEFHAQMRKLPSGGTIQVNRDFDMLTLDAQQIQTYSAMVASGQLSLETLWDILAEGGALPDEFNADEEKLAIDAEMLTSPPDLEVVEA